MGCCRRCRLFLFFFNDTATTEIYTLSLHDALPIHERSATPPKGSRYVRAPDHLAFIDRKSTRLNSSHVAISYAGFCLKKKNNTYMLSWSAFTRSFANIVSWCTFTS